VKIVGQAFRESGREFDLGVFDEAHKTAGMQEKKNTFGFALLDENVPIKKRLFGTATPRVRIRNSDADGHDPVFISMDNPAIYGTKAYEISFREAAEKDIIVPYKVIISIINDDNIKPEDLDTVVRDSHNKVIDARTVANMAAMERAMEKFGLKKAITFHNTIDAAEDFARVQHSIEGATLNDFKRLHVNGSQNSAVRDAVMRIYAEQDVKSIISNAKCLTEGVNVTATDVVAFMDPKSSKVDIIQAIGRALRNHDGKEFGYVFLPLHVSRKEGETYEEAFGRSMADFDQIKDVLKALADSDITLRDTLKKIGYIPRAKESDDEDGEDDVEKRADRLREEALYREIVDGLPIQIIHDNYPFELDPNALVRAIEARVINDSTNSNDAHWAESFEALKTFVRANDGRYPRHRTPEEEFLAQWVNRQRQRTGLTAQREALLNAMEPPFVWDGQEAVWLQTLEDLKTFVRENNGTYPKQNGASEEEKFLARWVSAQRQRQGLTAQRENLLNESGFAWTATEQKTKILAAPTSNSISTPIDVVPEVPSTDSKSITEDPISAQKPEKPVVHSIPSLESIRKYVDEIDEHEKTGESSGKKSIGETEIRTLQKPFSEILKFAYGGYCPITQSIPPFAQAAHLHVSGTCKADWRFDNSRGILLHADIHMAYDHSFLNIDQDTGAMRVFDEFRDKPEFKWLMDKADGKTVPIVNIHDESTWPALKAERDELAKEQISLRIKALMKDTTLSKAEKVSELKICMEALSALTSPYPYEDENDSSTIESIDAEDYKEEYTVRERMVG
jgi:superfamily II DNA or RNA helicase